MADAIDNGWDHKIVFPIIQKYLSDRKFPHAVTTTAIYDAIITEPNIQKNRIIRLEWCINYALRNLGYRKDSRTGRGYTKSNLGILVPM